MKLVVNLPDGSTQEYHFEKGPVYIGRQLGSTIFLPALSVSRQHARFQRDQEGLIVHDLDSKNGLMVNGRHTLHNLLENGDRLTFGKVEATFHNQR